MTLEMYSKFNRGLPKILVKRGHFVISLPPSPSSDDVFYEETLNTFIDEAEGAKQSIDADVDGD